MYHKMQHKQPTKEPTTLMERLLADEVKLRRSLDHIEYLLNKKRFQREQRK